MFLKKFIKNENLYEVVSEAIKFNKNIMRSPYKNENLILKLKYNIPEIFKNFVNGEENINLEKSEFNIEIKRSGRVYNSFEDWMQKVVWYGHRSGAYTYDYVFSKSDNITPKNFGESLNLCN
jgi:hypothetical protein